MVKLIKSQLISKNTTKTTKYIHFRLNNGNLIQMAMKPGSMDFILETVILMAII